MTEKQFQKDIIKAAEFLGWSVYHVVNVRKQLRSFTSVGFPDLVLVRERVMFRELKAKHGKLSIPQKIWLKRLQAAGQDAKVWTTETPWQEITDELIWKSTFPEESP